MYPSPPHLIPFTYHIQSILKKNKPTWTQRKASRGRDTHIECHTLISECEKIQKMYPSPPHLIPFTYHIQSILKKNKQKKSSLTPYLIPFTYHIQSILKKKKTNLDPKKASRGRDTHIECLTLISECEKIQKMYPSPPHLIPFTYHIQSILKKKKPTWTQRKASRGRDTHIECHTLISECEKIQKMYPSPPT